MPDWNPRANEIFLEAVEIENPSERRRFLDEKCSGDDNLRAQVDSLLAASAELGDFLVRPAAPPDDVTEAKSDGGEPTIGEGPGSVVGPYKLLQRIGEGGFGVVFMAEQEKPVRRMVAFKIIKPGMDTREVIARFESERQALAMMDHPHIARVLDAGATVSGRPYFVMELVRGVPITDFCDKNHMQAQERLRLFIDVCHAIQHAHHKGIIHRDIKPSNVMVTLHDGVPVVKVIDFGVAKATIQKLTERTLFTAFGQMIGTPAYMSPEQAEMSGLDIDTRSDVYSLGVLLYELLTGTTPLEARKLRQAGYAEMQRMIREEEPPRPSARLSSLGDTATILAGNRGTEPRRLVQLVAGDLDWIVMKALAKDRDRRYGTPGVLAEDVDRYLRRDAIQARPPSTVYRLKKFAQRNRAAVFTTAFVALGLVVGTVFSSWQAIRATRAEVKTLALLREADHLRALEAEERERAQASAAAEKAAKESAQENEAETRAVLKFVESRVFAAARPQGQDGGMGHEVKLADAIKSSLPFVESAFPNQPLIEARLRMSMGLSFLYLGDAATAERQFQRARDLRAQHLGPDEPDTLASMNNLATSYETLGRHVEALKLREETLALRKSKLGPDHPDTLASMNNLATSYEALGRHAEALNLREETLALRKSKLGPDHPDTLKSMNGLAASYYSHRRHAEALKLFQETLALRKAKLGPDHPDTLESMNNLALSYHVLGRHAEALKLHEETLALKKSKLGPDHPDTLMSMNNLSLSYDHLGRHAEALKLLEETLALMKSKLGSDHPDTLMIMNNLADRHVALGRRAEALKLREERLALMKTRLGPDHPDTLMSMNDLAFVLATTPDVKLRDPRRALELAQKAAQASPNDSSFLGTLGTARYRTGDWKGAIADLEKTISLRKPDDPTNANEAYFLAMAHWRLGEKDKAREWFAKAEAWMQKGPTDDDQLKGFRAEAVDLMGAPAKP